MDVAGTYGHRQYMAGVPVLGATDIAAEEVATARGLEPGVKNIRTCLHRRAAGYAKRKRLMCDVDVV